MASKRKAFLSRSVSLSLAALIVLTGAMFLITTLEQDHQEWVLVEDQVLDEYGLLSSASAKTDAGEYLFSFDEETSVYTYAVSGGSKASTSSYQEYAFVCTDGFDYSKDYKFVFSTTLVPKSFTYVSGLSVRDLFDLRSVSAEDGVYSAEVVLLDQYITDLSYQDCFLFVDGTGSSGTFSEDEFTLQVYELQDDNAGSIAAAITGLTLIVMGVFATPMLNVFRRR